MHHSVAGAAKAKALRAADETGAAFSRAQLRDQIATMIVAGHETTALTLFSAAGLLDLVCGRVDGPFELGMRRCGLGVRNLLGGEATMRMSRKPENRRRRGCKLAGVAEPRLAREGSVPR
jgi:hypothetical protein